jgi:hypothetical protein
MKLTATKFTAFLTGFLLTSATMLLDIAKTHSLISFNADSPGIFPFFIGYFFITGIVFVIGIQLISQSTFASIPFTSIPKDQEGWKAMFNTWGRMLAWFFGCVVGVILLLPFK